MLQLCGQNDRFGSPASGLESISQLGFALAEMTASVIRPFRLLRRGRGMPRRRDELVRNDRADRDLQSWTQRVFPQLSIDVKAELCLSTNMKRSARVRPLFLLINGHFYLAKCPFYGLHGLSLPDCGCCHQAFFGVLPSCHSERVL